MWRCKHCGGFEPYDFFAELKQCTGRSHIAPPDIEEVEVVEAAALQRAEAERDALKAEAEHLLSVMAPEWVPGSQQRLRAALAAPPTEQGGGE